MDDKMVCSFRTQYSPHDRVISNSGDRIVTEYEGYLDEVGDVQLREVGKHDLYAEIQSHRDSVDIHVLMQRYADGDTAALSRVQGLYADITEMPKTYAELLNTVMAGQQAFDQLPIEVKERFGNDFGHWMALMDSPDEWRKLMGMSDTVKNDFDEEKEVKTDES